MRPFLIVILGLLPCLGQDLEPGEVQETSTDYQSRFEELATRYETLEKQYYAQKPPADEDPVTRFLENHPMNTMVGDFLTLEQNARGTKIGFSCLYHLVMTAGSVIDADYPVTKGKIAALSILGEHYHDYPDVDTTCRRAIGGARVPEAKDFLRNLIDCSRHRYVRATAMYELAACLAMEANRPAMIESRLAVMDREDPENESRVKLFEEFSASLKDVDVKQNRVEAASLVKQIQNDFGDELLPPSVNVRTPGIVEVVRSDDEDILGAKRQRVVDRLQGILFELNHSIGQLAPAIDGDDVTGKPMSLAGFRGNVVVLMFSTKGCGPCERMYPDNRKLIKKLSGQPFVFVGVQGDETIDTVLESLDSQKITWRVWWNGKGNERISSQWNVRGWPSIFVLDQHGVIRFRDIRGQDLANAVSSLLK